MNKRAWIKFLNRLLLGVYNASRSVFASVFGLIFNYILLQEKLPVVLNTYVYCISLVNLLLVFSNWGGKDYITKTLAQNYHKTAQLAGSILGSRLLMALLFAAGSLFIPSNPATAVFIAFYLFLKTLAPVFESLVTLEKKFERFLLFDFILSAAFICLVFFDGNTANPAILLAELVVLELLRLALYLAVFRKKIVFRFNIIETIKILKQATPFFFISLAGFICSRADLYVLGLVTDNHQMSLYFVISNLVSLCHVIYSTLIGAFTSSIFRYNPHIFAKFSAQSVIYGLLFAPAAAVGIYCICMFYYGIAIGIPFSLTIVANVFLFTRTLTEMYLFTRRESQTQALYALLVSGVFNVILSYVLAQQFGFEGAFYANTITALILYLLLRFMPAISAKLK